MEISATKSNERFLGVRLKYERFTNKKMPFPSASVLASYLFFLRERFWKEIQRVAFIQKSFVSLAPTSVLKFGAFP